jgi:hypothetical protein
MPKNQKPKVTEIPEQPKTSSKKTSKGLPEKPKITPKLDSATLLDDSSQKADIKTSEINTWQRIKIIFTPKGPIGRWIYLVIAAFAIAVVIIIVGANILSGKNEPVKEITEVNINSSTQEQLPFAPDLVGGNRYAYGHYYPMAVIIDNASPARPQSGLQSASLVYEALVEGGITRFMAIFDQGSVTQIGPVRSSRAYFLEWLAEYDAAYAHAGGSPEALSNIRKERVHDINGIGNAAGSFGRDRTRPAPHNLYTSSFNIYKTIVANNWKYSDAQITPWLFSKVGDPAPTDAKVANKVTMYFTGTTKSTQIIYTYDAAKGGYLRSQAGQPHKDRLTNAQILVKNLVIQNISNSIGVGEKGRLTMKVNGTGKAKIIENGTVREVTWSKTSPEARTIFTGVDGNPATFSPGNTWVEVLPEGRTVNIE